MIRVTLNENHKHIGFGEEEIILSGPPLALRGPVILRNSTDEHIFIRELPMKNAKNAEAVFPVHTTLKPREVKSENIYYSIDPLTPPPRKYLQDGFTNRQ